MRSGKGERVTNSETGVVDARPLPSLLSQVLVAFTLEFDNEFERRMKEDGQPGAPLSMVVWSNLMRFLADGRVAVRALAAQALAPEKQIKFELGCLERWRFIALQADASDKKLAGTHREGWGSGRGIRSGWMVCLTEKGRKACGIWPELFGEIERRWQMRFGEDAIDRFRQALESVVGQLDLELPQGLPVSWEAGYAYPSRATDAAPDQTGSATLPVLLSQLLLRFTMDFDRDSRAPLSLCANTLRVLSEQATPVRDIPRLTGTSPETSAVRWQVKPYVTIEADPAASRGKVVRLTPLGLRTQQRYRELVAQIETRWEEQFGENSVQRLRECLRELLVRRRGDQVLLAEGLIPAEGTVRAGECAPALGRRDVGAAARQRMRDLASQTEMFLRDPAGTLPHYPLWDMNRGFGP